MVTHIYTAFQNNTPADKQNKEEKISVSSVFAPLSLQTAFINP